MAPGARRAVAGAAILIFLAFWIWAAIEVADRLPDHPLIDAVYFLIVGAGWGVPLLPLLKWAGGGGKP